uniref:Uncharacterized protein n=1 Tax=Ascaris lumbricoides TaxID=6252 RepID=A0A0M3I8R6_ASCLU
MPIEASIQKTAQLSDSNPPTIIVVHDADGDEHGRLTWTKRLSKSIHRRSGSFLNSLVPFRKSGIEHSHNKRHSPSPLTTPRQRRRASATPAVCYNTLNECGELQAIIQSEKQRQRSADRIFVINGAKVSAICLQ